jgi:prephenate dehydrogenase
MIPRPIRGIFFIMTVTIIGTGLIGCSMANRLRETGFAQRIIGVDNNVHHIATALQLGWIDETMPMADAIRESELVIIAIPVDATLKILPAVLVSLDQQVLMDVGSTKALICGSVVHNAKRGRFVATHPMWGTEKEGPGSVVKDAFKGRVAVICEKASSDADAVQLV